MAIAACSAVGLLLLYLVAVRTHLGQEFDDLAFEGRAVVDPGVTRATNELLHSITRSSLVLLTAAVVLFALARRRFRLALIVGSAVTVSVLTAEVLKHRVLDRPSLDDIAGIGFNSFPSGHATIGMALSLAVVMVAPHRWRWLAALLAMSLALAFGTGVVATGWHRPSDVIGAFLVCTAVFATATFVLLRWRGTGDEATRFFGEVESQLTPSTVAGAGALIAAAAGVAIWRTTQQDGLRTVEFAWDYVAVCLAILGAGITIILGYHELLRGVSLDAPRYSLHRADLGE